MSILSKYRHAILVAAFLFIFIAQACSIADKKSNTWDEPAHIMSGYAYATEGIDYLSPLNHPVFGRLLTGILPAALIDLDFNKAVKPEGSTGSDFFPYSVKFLYENKTDGDTVLFLARLPNIILGAILGIYIFIWSKKLWGIKGAYLSLFFYTLSPNILAHTSLATTDMPATAFFFISAYYLYKLSNNLRPINALAVSVALALAFTSKHTAMLLLPLFAFALIASIKKEGIKALSYYLSIILLTYIFIWGIYGFRYHSASPYYQPLMWSKFASSSFMPFFDKLRALKILPEAYLYSIAGVLMGVADGKPAFLMGQYSDAGWWYYFIIAFLIKTPIPTIVFFIASALYSIVEKENLKKALILIIPASIIFTMFSLQKVNIGLRHILPAYPFLFTLLGFVPNIKTQSIKMARAIFYGGIVWYAYSAALIYPNQLAYFNELIGGPKNGYKYLADSNIDWGQDLKALKIFMDEHQIKSIKLAYFGCSDPKYFGINYEYLPSFMIPEPQNAKDEIPLKGWFAISATMLDGVYLTDKDFYAPFRQVKPYGNVGHSIFIYRF